MIFVKYSILNVFQFLLSIFFSNINLCCAQVLRNQFNNAQNKVSQLFKQLTTEATRLEKLKAKYGAGGGSLQAFLQVYP